ncbi:ATP-binding protein [Aliagarivorans marinus]|uniref:ATP-binding protein n=1 Tax=Aliagarivorans marinus TaxID=561965 RepID=UPI0003FE35D6|nr:ATP-binding protein [Aliagarivorans marinus]
MIVIDAEYATHPDANLNGNPLSEAIEVSLDRDVLLNNIVSKPNIQTNFWSLPPFYQMTQLRQLTDAHQPLPQTWLMYNKIMSMILYSYVRRDPFSPEMVRLKSRLAEQMRQEKVKFIHPVGLTTAPSALVTGDSGTGKTTMIRTLQSGIPQVVNHRSYKGKHFANKQLVWVSFDLPPTGSAKAMAVNFFRAVDAALGTEYADEWSARDRESVDKHLTAMQICALEHNLGMAHVDELQFMLGYSKSLNSPNLQILEALFNKIGVPILQSCTAEGVDVFKALPSGDYRIGTDTTTVRRMLNDREYRLSNHDLSSTYFSELFDSLFPKALEHPLTPKDAREGFKSKFHKLSCGLPAIMIRLALLHHETLVNLLENSNSNDGYHTYHEGLLEMVYRNQFSLIDPALAQYRRGDKSGYEKSIRTDSSKTAYSNAEVVEERKKVPKKKVEIVKTEIPENQNLMLGVDSLSSEGEFLQGLEDDDNV